MSILKRNTAGSTHDESPMKIDQKTLDLVKDRLMEAYDPLAIYLFGSHAWGTPTDDSDLDLLVVIPDDRALERPYSLRGQMALSNLGIAKDLVVVKRESFHRQANHMATLYHKIKHEAISLYLRDGTV